MGLTPWQLSCRVIQARMNTHTGRVNVMFCVKPQIHATVVGHQAGFPQCRISDHVTWQSQRQIIQVMMYVTTSHLRLLKKVEWPCTLFYYPFLPPVEKLTKDRHLYTRYSERVCNRVCHQVGV